jgi:hypothetical protein
MTNLGKVIVWISLFSSAAAYAAPTPSPAVRRACAPDARRLCSSVISEPKKRRACMREHRDQLSEACRTAVMEQRKKSGGGSE